jgi:L-lactate dehydrogenase complex protein LldF
VSKDGFPAAAAVALQNSQLRHNVGKATTTIRAKRAAAVGELPDWEALRAAGSAIKAATMASLPEQLERLEASVTRAGGTVHWARDGAEVTAVVAEVARRHGTGEVIKVKSLATDEIDLNERLEAEGVHAIETDLAELINQLAGDWSSHILVPAIHRNRAEIRRLFEQTIAGGRELSDAPEALTEAARLHLREKFLTVPVAVSGANFAMADTGTVAVFESEGNGRMCTTLPRALVTVMGIEKVIPDWRDMGSTPSSCRAPRPPSGSTRTRRSGPACGPGTGPRSSTSCCSTTAARRCSPTRSAARRCIASAARRA